jgi:Subtilase family
MKTPIALVRSLSVLLSLTAIVAGAASGKKAVSSADDLPRHEYAITEAPSAMLGDADAMARLAAQVGRDCEADLRDYDITDRTTVENFKTTQLAIAMLKGDYASVPGIVSEIRAIEEKPAEKLTTGIVAVAWAEAHLRKPAPADLGKEIGALVKARVGQLPWDIVQDDVKETKAAYEIRTTALIVGMAQEQFDSAALKTHSISLSIARSLLAMRNSMVNLVPYREQIAAAYGDVIAAHTVPMEDLWTRRLVSLPPDAKAQLVRVGIWDSGSDESIFADRLNVDSEGRHGIAFNLHSEPVPELLLPLGDKHPDIGENMGRMKGYLDLSAGLDTPEASSLKKYMSGLKADQVKPTIEGLQFVSNYSHGTHVTGIALDGNPFARLVIGRITYDYRMIPELPTLEQARKDAVAYQTMVDYFKKNGVRVVNMSWGGSLKDVESALEANGAGGTPEQRKKLAREIFDVGKDGLEKALRSAPGILFVAAAGNSDNDVKFDDVIPSSFQLPNMITVGAVDQAGKETSFSSFGPMVNVHANGFEVESYVPGGQRLKFSGTSMAAPQVTNLAAKLFALDPSLTPEAAKDLITAGCERSGRVNLVNPAKSVQLLQKRLGSP